MSSCQSSCTPARQSAERVIGVLASLGRPIVSAVGPMPWIQANRLLDAIAPPGRRYYSKGGYLSELTDAAIDVVVTGAAAAPPAASPPLPSTVQNLWAPLRRDLDGFVCRPEVFGNHL
jgi:hypothetical protein